MFPYLTFSQINLPRSTPWTYRLFAAYNDVMGKLRILAALFLLLAGELALARPGGAFQERRVNARQLLRTVDSALSQVQGGLDPKDPKLAPFKSSLNAMRLRVNHIQTALDRRDGELLGLLDQGSADLGALRVAWARTGVENRKASDNLRLASVSYRSLRANYGREGLRLRQGGNLNEAERRHFQRLQRTQRRFAESLGPLRAISQRRGDRVTVAELDRFRGEAERIAAAPLELEAYLNSLIASGETRGEWEADAPYVRQDAPEDFVVANEMIEDLYVESDIGHVFAVDLDSAVAHLDQDVAVPPAVQIFQPAGDGEVELLPDAPILEELEAIEPVEVTGESEEELPEAPPAGGEAVEEEDLDLEEDAVVEPMSEDRQAVPPPGEPAKDLPAAAGPPPPPADSHPVKPPIG